MIWHPFTAQTTNDTLPLKIARAEREFLFDTSGKRYIDAIASWWTMVHGHRHPQIVAAIKKQLETLDHVIFAGFTHEPAELLAAELLRLTDNFFSHVFYSDNGSTAVEVMLKLALQYWRNRGETQRRTFVRFAAAYHGDTFGAMSVSAPSLFTRPFAEHLFTTRTFRYPQSADDTAFFSEWERFLHEESDTVAGVVIEPLIAAAGGMVFQQVKALQKLVAAARQHGALVLFDEVFTGMGRTGSFCAFQKAQFVPDLVALAKGLTGGVLPLGVTLITEKIHGAFVSNDPEHTFYHGHTMTGNPVGCAAALASVALVHPGLLAQVTELEKKQRELWNSIAMRHGEKIKNVRSLGAVSAADLVTHSEKPGYTFSWAQRLRTLALEQGVVLRPLGNVLYTTPPYTISDTSLEQVFACIDNLLKAYAP